MSSRSGGRTSEDETNKKSRSHSRHSSSSSRRKRSHESSNHSDESKVKHRKHEHEYPSSRPSESHHYRTTHHDHDRNNSHRGSQKNNSHSANSFRRPRSRSQSREKRRTPDKYANKDRGSRRRSPDWGRDRHSDRDNSRYTGRLGERDSTTSLPSKTGERDKPSSSENSRSSGRVEEVLSKIPVSSFCPESWIRPGGPGTTKLVEEVEKRKLLFSKKEKPVESSSSSVWDGTKFSQDSDGKMTAKFKRLMGIKDEGPSGIPDEKPQTAAKQDEYFADLEKQYEVARVTTHTQRGVGFGFSSSRIFPLNPKP